MEIDVSEALATLQRDPENQQALTALKGLHPGNGSGVDVEAVSVALRDARRWHRERGDHELCIELIDLEVPWTRDAERAATLHHEKARILADELLRDGDAEVSFRRALDAYPGHTASSEALAQMSLVRANWKPIAARYAKQADETQSRELAASLYLSAAEMQLKFDPSGGEGEKLLRKSIDLDPRNRRAGQHWERLLRRANRKEELLAFLNKRAESAGTKEERALAEIAAAEMAERDGKADVAFQSYQRALELNPNEARALKPVIAALTAKGAWDDLAEVLETAVRSRRGETDAALLGRLLELQWKQRKDLDAAERTARRLRKLDGGHPLMVDFYRAYHTQRNELPQLLAVLAQAQRTDTDVDRRVALGIEMARLAENRGGQNNEKVIDLWKGLLRLRPHLPEGVQALRKLYTQGQKWNALLELLKEDLEALPAKALDEKIARYMEIVEIYRDRLNLDVMVVNTYLNVLQLRPDHPQALAALAARYEAQGRWGDLVTVLTKQADAMPDVTARLGIHRRIAGIWVDKLGKHQNAVSSLEKILEADPSDRATIERLRDLYTKSRAWRSLLELSKKELPLLDTMARRARLAEMARLAAERLSDNRESVNVWNRVLEMDPMDAEALTGLAALYERERRWAGLAEILARQAQAAKSPQDAVALLERQGVLLYEKLSAADAAAEVFRRVQGLQPQNPRAQKALREIYAQSGNVDALEALYAAHGSYEELCEALTALAERAGSVDTALRVRLLERVAKISSERLKQPERSLRAYEKVLSLDPKSVRAAEALVPLYRTQQKWPRLVATYEVLLLAKGADAPVIEPERRLAMLAECRQVAEQRLGSKQAAFLWAARAFELAPSDEKTVAELDRLAAESEEWTAYASLLEKHLATATAQEERLASLRRLLGTQMGKLAKPADARKSATEILTLVPGDPEAEGALEQVLSQLQAFPDLAGLLRERAARTTEPAEKVKILFKIAGLEEEKIHDLEAAQRSFEAVAALASSPDVEGKAFRGLTRVLEARQDWTTLLDILRKGAARQAGAESEELRLRMAEVQDKHLDDKEGTFATLQEILAANPLSAGAVAVLERVAPALPARRGEIARMSLPYYQRTDNAPKLATAYQSLVETSADNGEKLGYLERLVALESGPLKNPSAAYGAALEIFALAPEKAVNRETLAHLAVETRAVPDLAGKLKATATSTQDGALRRDLLVELAALQEQQLGNRDEAERVYREILSVEPLHPGAFRALGRLYREAERWSELRALLETRVQATSEPTERIDLLAQVAEIDESVLDDADHAIATYERMLEVDPADPRAYRALDRHYAARERWRDREHLLERRSHFAADGEMSELEFRRAELRFQKFGDAEGAIDLLEGILKKEPRHEQARNLLERTLAAPEQKRRAAKILEPLYEAAGEWAKMVSVLEIEREGLSGPDAGEVLARIANIQEAKLNSPLTAMQTWRAVLGTDPNHDDALREVERHARALARWSDLVDVYQELAFRKDAGDVEARADLLSRAAKLYVDPLANKRAAIETWKMVLNLDPENYTTAKPAADALEHLYVETENVDALVKVLRLRAGWADTREERRALLFRIAELEETELGDANAAVATLRAVVEQDGENLDALGGLERLLAATGQHRARVEVLRRRGELTRDPAARQALLRQVATLLETEVGDLDEAVRANVAVLDEIPDDVTALESLARLYEKQGRHPDRLATLERRLALSKVEGGTQKEITARVDILRRIAELLAGPIGHQAEALQRWREILDLVPSDPGALAALEALLPEGLDASLRAEAGRALEPVYQEAGRWAELASVLQIFVDVTEEPRSRVEHLVRLAKLQESRLKDTDGAFASTSAAIRDSLSDASLGDLLNDAERLAGSTRTTELVTLYRDIEPDVLDEKLRLRVDRAVAARAQQLGDDLLAVDYFRRVIDRLPSDEEALQALEALYRRMDDAGALYDILLRRAELAADPSTERRLKVQLGALAAERLDRPDEAIAAYERVLVLGPDDREATSALDQLYTRRDRWPDLARLLEGTLSRRLPENEAVALRVRLADIAIRYSHDNETALGHLRHVLRSDPEQAQAISMLEAMLDDSAVQVLAAELLEPVYAGRQDWTALIRTVEIRLAQAQDSAQRLGWTKRIARLYEEQLEDDDSALRWYARVFQESPEERLSADQLVRLGGRMGRWRELAEIFGNYLEGELGEEPHVLDIVRRTAELYDEKLEDPGQAKRYYRRLFEARPDDSETALTLENAFSRWENWLELREFLDERAGRATDLEQKKALLARSAQLDEERLDDLPRAMQTLREILSLDPDDDGASDYLERLLREKGEWADLAEHLEVRIGRAQAPAEREAVSFRLAQVQQTQLGNPAGAVERYAEILTANPVHRDAVTALEGLMAEKDFRHRVATVLEPVYRSAQSWGKLASALEAQLEFVDDRGERVRLLREVADIQQRLARVDSAFETRSRAWLVDVSNTETLSDLKALAMSARLYGLLVETLKRGATTADDPELQAKFWGEAAELLESSLGDATGAINAWREALNARLDDAHAFAALERLLATQNRPSELVEVLEQHLEVAADAAERKSLAQRVASLYEHTLKDRDRAIDAWRAALDIDETDQEALDALHRLYVQSLAWRDLAGIVQRKIELTHDVQELRLMRLMAARLYDERLGEPDEAVSQLRAVLETVPADPEALEILDLILTRESRHADLLEVLDRRAQAAVAPEERDGYAVRAAALVDKELSDPRGAIDRYQEILARSPEHAEAQAALWTLAKESDDRLPAIAALEPVLRTRGAWNELVELLELRAAAEDHAAARFETFAEIAELEEAQRHDAAHAFHAWARALAEEPTDERARAAVERLAETTGDHAALARLYEERLEGTYDSALQRSLSVRLGELFEGTLNDPTRAVDFLKRAMDLPGDQIGVLESLERLHRRLSSFDALAETLALAADATTDPLRQADLLASLGEVRLTHLDDPENALAAFRAALEKAPEHNVAHEALSRLLERDDTREGALDVLEPLAESRSDYAELVVLYQHRLASRDDRSERAGWLRRIAEVEDGRLGRPAQAVAALAQALHEEPVLGETVDDLERVASTSPELQIEAARAIEAVLAEADPTAARELALRAARLFETNPAERASAERLYLRVLADDPESRDALSALESLYRASGDEGALASVLEKRAAAELDPAERRRFFVEAAGLRERLGDVDAALAAWQTLREAEEGDTAVLTELARLLEQQGRLVDLTDVLQERARFAQNDRERAAFLAKVGEIRLHQLNDVDGAAEAFREALDTSPQDENLLGALEGIQEQRQDWTTLQEVLLRRLGVAEGTAQIPILQRLARNAERRLGDVDQAVGFLLQCLDLDAHNGQAFLELERLLREHERWYDLVDVLGKHADAEGAAGRRPTELALRVAIANVWEEKIQSPESATEALEKVLALAPDHVGALLALARLHEGAERWDEAESMLDRAAAASSTQHDAAEILFRKAKIRAAQGASAAEQDEAYRQALGHDPTHEPSLRALENLARERQNQPVLAQLLEMRLAGTHDETERKLLLDELRLLWKGPLDDKTRALGFLEQLVALAPDDAATSEELAVAYVENGHYPEASRLLERLLEMATKARRNKDIARFQAQLGRLAEATGDLQLAADRFGAAYKLDPGNAATLASLGRLSLRHNDLEAARKYFRALLLQTFDAATAGITKAEVYLQLGRLHLAANEAPKARNMFERGLESDPQNAELKAALGALGPR